MVIDKEGGGKMILNGHLQEGFRAYYLWGPHCVSREKKKNVVGVLLVGKGVLQDD